MFKLTLLLFSLLASINISACKCEKPTIERSFKAADFVFIGDVYDVNTTYKTGYWEVENSLSKVRIEKVYKFPGNDFRSKEITLFGQQFNSCDVIFTNKGKFLIFANVEPDTTFFYSSLCYATQEVSHLNESDFALLEKLNKEFAENSSERNNSDEFVDISPQSSDKIINKLKFKNLQLSEHNRELQYYLIAISVAFLLASIIVVAVYRRKKHR